MFKTITVRADPRLPSNRTPAWAPAAISSTLYLCAPVLHASLLSLAVPVRLHCAHNARHALRLNLNFTRQQSGTFQNSKPEYSSFQTTFPFRSFQLNLSHDGERKCSISLSEERISNIQNSISVTSTHYCHFTNISTCILFSLVYQVQLL